MNNMQACLSISNIFEKPLVLVDVETTGLSPKNAEMIEIAAIRIEEGRISDSVSQLIQPRHHYISSTITRITGITEYDVEGQPFFSDIAQEVVNLFTDQAIFVAHNVSFDYSFVQTALEDLDMEFIPARFDTVRLSRKLYPLQPSHSLENIIRTHSIPVRNRHRAHADALAMWQFMQKAMLDKGETSFSAAVQAQL